MMLDRLLVKLIVNFPYVHRDIDRHGNVRFYYRRRIGEPKIRLRAQGGTPEFAAEYEAAQARCKVVPSDSPSALQRRQKGTLGWLCGLYLRSAEFGRFAKTTQSLRRWQLERLLLEPVAPGKKETFADFPLPRLTAKALRVLRDRKEDLPGSANHRVKALRALFSWAVDHDLVQSNPASEVKLLKRFSTGHHTWTAAEIAQFESRHPIGTKARLALALLLLTGVRRSDVVLLGRQHLKDGWFKISVQKNRNRTPVTVELPLAPDLARIIDASPVGDLTFLVTKRGKPFTAEGFGEWFRERCNEVGLRNCSAHGLRKAGAVRAAENGATAHELMALFGWLSLSEAQRYTRSADRRRLAKNAARLMAPSNGQSENK
jgi:integrase